MNQTLKNWRTRIPVHPAAEVIPPMTEEEFNRLADDIAKHGLRSPIVMWWPRDDSPAQLLDGRHRLDALERLAERQQADRLGARICEVPDVVGRSICLCLFGEPAPSSSDDRTTQGDRSNVERSDREIGRMTALDKNTVSRIRADAEARGEIHHVERRSDSLGRSLPASKPTRPGMSSEEFERQVTSMLGKSLRPDQGHEISRDVRTALADMVANLTQLLELDPTRTLNEIVRLAQVIGPHEVVRVEC